VLPLLLTAGVVVAIRGSIRDSRNPVPLTVTCRVPEGRSRLAKMCPHRV